MSEDSPFFTKIHNCLLSLLQTQQKGAPAGPSVRLLHATLKEGYANESHDVKEKSACRTAVAAALRVALEQSLNNGSFPQLYQEYVMLVETLFSFTDISDPESIAWKHMKPLITHFMMAFDKDVKHRAVLIRALMSCVQFSLSRKLILAELFSLEFLPGYGKLVASFLDVVKDSAVDGATRVSTFRVLRCLLDASPLNILTVVLPGVLTAIAQLCRCDPTILPDLHVDMLETYTSLIVRTLSNDQWERACKESHDDTSTESKSEASASTTARIEKLLVKRDKQWMLETAAHVKPQLLELCAVFCCHRERRVRFVLLSLLEKLNFVEAVFDGSLCALIIDSLMVLSGDEDALISCKAEALQGEYGRPHAAEYSLHIHKKLMEVTSNLPLKTGSGSDCKSLFDQVACLINCARTNRALCVGGSLRKLFGAVAQAVRVDTRRLALSRSEELVGTMQDFLVTLPLKHGVQWNWLRKICRNAAALDVEEMSDVFVDLLDEVGPEERTSLALIFSLFIAEISETQFVAGILQSCCERALTRIEELDVEREVRDEIVEDQTVAHSNASSLLMSLVCLVGSALGAIKDVRQQNTLLIDALCTLLQCTSTPNAMVSEAAEQALLHVAKSQEVTLSDLLASHGVLIVNKLTYYSRIYATRPHSARLLASFVDHVDTVDEELRDNVYPHVKHAAMQLMRALDENNQERSILILNALTVFIKALDRWFPNLGAIPANECCSTQPSTSGTVFIEETGEQVPDLNDAPTIDADKAPAPDQVACAELILKRTQHLLSSPHMPIRMICLRLLSASLYVVRYYDDILLPMVHQNWASLRHRLRDENMLVTIEAAKVLDVMCQLTGTFVYRRFRDAAWPLLTRNVEQQLARAQYSQSEAYRFVMVVLQRTVSMWTHVRVRGDDDGALVEPLLEKISQSAAVPLELKRLASEALDRFKMIPTS